MKFVEMELCVALLFSELGQSCEVQSVKKKNNKEQPYLFQYKLL